MATRAYQLSMPHSGAARRLVKADLAAFRRVARIQSPTFDRTLPVLSTAANHSALWMLLGAGLATWGGRFGKRAAIRGLGSVAVTSTLVSGGLKHLFRRPRPALRDIPLARRLTRQPLTTSFPSGHAASAGAFVVGVASEAPSLGPPVAALGGAVAFSRVYTGVHYPIDVLVGAAVGSAVALLSRVPWPLVPPVAREPAAVGPRHRLDRNEDGAGLALVVNHDAGPALRGAPLERLRAELPRARIVERHEADDLTEILEGLVGESTALGICGGDGSVNAAAEFALAHERPLLVVPGGTLNHLARDLRVRSPEDAVRAFTRGEAVGVDVGMIDGRPFLNSAGFGAYTEMVDRRKSLEAVLGRWPAHILGAVKTHFAHRPMTVTLDGRARRLWMVFVGNCRHEPPGFAPSWRPRLDDGVLDVRLVDAAPAWARLKLTLAVLSGRLANCAAYEQWEARELRVDSGQSEMRLGADGQTFDGDGAFSVEKRPGTLLVYAPHS